MRLEKWFRGRFWTALHCLMTRVNFPSEQCLPDRTLSDRKQPEGWRKRWAQLPRPHGRKIHAEISGADEEPASKHPDDHSRPREQLREGDEARDW